MHYRKSLVASCALAAMLLWPGVVLSMAQNHNSQPLNVSAIADRLAEFERHTIDAKDASESLLSITSNPNVSWQSHASYLAMLRERVNDMGRLLAELENMKVQATELQQVAIEKARPPLAALAAEAERAIVIIRDGRQRILDPEYKDTIESMNRYSVQLYETVDASIEHDELHRRLEHDELHRRLERLQQSAISAPGN